MWCLGYPSQAVEVNQQALAYASELRHPLSLIYALTWDVMLYCHLKAFSLAEEKTKALVDFSQEHQMPFWLGYGLVLQGWVRAELGEIDAGIGLIWEGMESYRVTGAEFMRPFFLSLLVEQYGRIGEIPRGFMLLDEAQAIIDQSGERWYQAELYRRQGELFLKKDNEVDAEGAFYRAIEVSRSQKARMLELRAAVQLANLWRRQDRGAEAQQLLEPIYGWFREGFVTPDLRAACELLEN
jgi:predicted ATPase